MYLADTNIFLELLLSQEKHKVCKEFLYKNLAHLNISDFSLHSIGVILFKKRRETTFLKFADDFVSKVGILTLSKANYPGLAGTGRKLSLDFDDSYQFAVAKEHGLKIVSMDRDFEKVKGEIEVIFL